MRCPRCGAAVGRGDLSCPECGWLFLGDAGIEAPGEGPEEVGRGRRPEEAGAGRTDKGAPRREEEGATGVATATERLVLTRKLLAALEAHDVEVARETLDALERLGPPSRSLRNLRERVEALERKKRRPDPRGKKGQDTRSGGGSGEALKITLLVLLLVLPALAILKTVVGFIGHREDRPSRIVGQPGPRTRPGPRKGEPARPGTARRPVPPELAAAWEKGELDRVLAGLGELSPEVVGREPWSSARTWLPRAKRHALAGDCVGARGALVQAAGGTALPVPLGEAIARLCVPVVAAELRTAQASEDETNVRVLVAQLDSVRDWSREAEELAVRVQGWLERRQAWKNLERQGRDALARGDLLAARQALAELRATGAPSPYTRSLAEKLDGAGDGAKEEGGTPLLPSPPESRGNRSISTAELLERLDAALVERDPESVRRLLGLLEEANDVPAEVLARARRRSAELLRGLQRKAGERLVLEAGGTHLAFRWVPPGTATLGSRPGEPCADPGEERSRREVSFEDGFWLGETEVTRWHWQGIMDVPESGPCPGCPVTGVGLKEIELFLDKLNGELAEWRARLPTEDEWEYACRAGEHGPFSPPVVRYSEKNCRRTAPGLEKIGWYRRSSRRRPHPVGELAPNAWGLYDMHGNAAELCLDRAGNGVVAKGGSWKDPPVACRAGARSKVRSPRARRRCGFRILLEPRKGGPT